MRRIRKIGRIRKVRNSELGPGRRTSKAVKCLIALVMAALLVLNLPGLFIPENIDAANSGKAADSPGFKAVVVRTGDTLWDLATTHGPAGVDPRVTVYRIQEVNELSSPVIHPGQELLVPTS